MNFAKFLENSGYGISLLIQKYAYASAFSYLNSYKMHWSALYSTLTENTWTSNCVIWLKFTDENTKVINKVWKIIINKYN